MLLDTQPGTAGATPGGPPGMPPEALAALKHVIQDLEKADPGVAPHASEMVLQAKVHARDRPCPSQ